MFTREEKDFIDSSPEFVRLLRGMTDKEVSAFIELLSHICDLSQTEKEFLCRKVDSELSKMERPSRIEFAQMVAREIKKGEQDLSLLDTDYLEDCYKRYMKGDFAVMNEVKAAVAEKKMEKAVVTPPPVKCWKR